MEDVGYDAQDILNMKEQITQFLTFFEKMMNTCEDLDEIYTHLRKAIKLMKI